jgi:spore coat polysaccharide biosynthesis protein SpsF
MSGARVVAIVQARMGSTRLPGKVLAEIAGEPMLVRTVERARLAKTVDDLLVATTQTAADDAVEALCRARGYAVYRGSTEDVLDTAQPSRRRPT